MGASSQCAASSSSQPHAGCSAFRLVIVVLMLQHLEFPMAGQAQPTSLKPLAARRAARAAHVFARAKPQFPSKTVWSRKPLKRDGLQSTSSFDGCILERISLATSLRIYTHVVWKKMLETSGFKITGSFPLLPRGVGHT